MAKNTYDAGQHTHCSVNDLEVGDFFKINEDGYVRKVTEVYRSYIVCEPWTYYRRQSSGITIEMDKSNKQVILTQMPRR